MSRGNNVWRHYVHEDAQGLETHYKAVWSEDSFEFFQGTASGKPIPDSDSPDSDSDAQDGDLEGVSPAAAPSAAEDTSASAAGQRPKRKAADQAEAAEAAPGAQKGPKRGRKCGKTRA